MDAVTYSAELDDLLKKVNELPWAHRSDAIKLWSNCRAYIDILSKEGVECNRFHKKTARYIDLETKFKTQKEELEQWITYVHLIEI